MSTSAATASTADDTEAKLRKEKEIEIMLTVLAEADNFTARERYILFTFLLSEPFSGAGRPLKLRESLKYMSLMIKAYSGKSALEWLNEYVIMEARLLLDYTDLTVQEISYRLNFPTQSAFGKYFRQQVGVSPKS